MEMARPQGSWLAARPLESGADSGRDLQIDGHPPATQSPPARGQTMRGLQRGGCLFEAAAGFRGEKNHFKTRRHRANSADNGVHPLSDRPVCVVVKGVHVFGKLISKELVPTFVLEA